MMKKLLCLVVMSLLLLGSALAVQITNNGDGTYNACWNNVPEAKLQRVFNGVSLTFAHKYFNATHIQEGLTNADKIFVFDQVSKNYWGGFVYDNELDETLILAKKAFDQSYDPPFSGGE